MAEGIFSRQDGVTGTLHRNIGGPRARALQFAGIVVESGDCNAHEMRFPRVSDYKVGEHVPRPHRGTVHDTCPGEVMHFDFLYFGESGPPRRLWVARRI